MISLIKSGEGSFGSLSFLLGPLPKINLSLDFELGDMDSNYHILVANFLIALLSICGFYIIKSHFQPLIIQSCSYINTHCFLGVFINKPLFIHESRQIGVGLISPTNIICYKLLKLLYGAKLGIWSLTSANFDTPISENYLISKIQVRVGFAPIRFLLHVGRCPLPHQTRFWARSQDATNAATDRCPHF